MSSIKYFVSKHISCIIIIIIIVVIIIIIYVYN